MAYFTKLPNYGTYFIFCPSETEAEYNERIAWINENCNGRVSATTIGFTFTRDSDAVLFKLRWA
jgi:hypothetical protein